MKQPLSLILAALLLASSMAACGKTEPETEKTETSVTETSVTETSVTETSVTETSVAESLATETDTPASYDTALVTENGIAKAHIVIAEGANSTINHAAKELVYHIGKVSGAEISVVNEVQEGSLPIIIATPDTLPELEELFPEELAWLREIGKVGDTERYGDDGFAIRTYEEKIYIFGANAKGALNGTYDFIEENMGVLWVRADEEKGLVYEEMPTITVLKTDYKEKSPFQIRGWHLSARSNQYSMVDMFARNKLSSLSALGSEDQGIGIFRVAHNLKAMLRYSPTYDPNESEYWNTNSEGKYLTYEQSTQVNFYSDKAARVIADNVIAYVKEGYSSPGIAPGPYGIFIGIEDLQNGSNVPYDSQPYEYAPGEFVSPTETNYQSTVYFSFFNKIARMVAEECPGTTISTFAYLFTENAPKCKLEDNLLVVMAPIHEDLTSSLYDTSSPQNSSIYRRMEAWKEITNNLVFYNYYGCFPTADRYTRPIWDRISEHLQYYADNGFYGLQPEGAASDDDNMFWFQYDGFGGYSYGGDSDLPNSVAWEMNCMTYWIFSKLCWNPYEDVDALIEEFCDKYYGAASEYMQEYYRLIEKGWEDGGEDLVVTFTWDLSWYYTSETFLFNPNFEEPLYEQIMEALNNAWEVADDKVKERMRYMKEQMEANVAEYLDE